MGTGAPTEVLARLRGERFAGGALSRLRIARALGLEDVPPAFAVRAVGWVDDHVEVLVGTGAGRTVRLEIGGREGRVRVLAVAEHLALRRGGQAMPHTLVRRIASAFVHRMARVTLQQVASALESDPDFAPGLLVAVESAPRGAGSGGDVPLQDDPPGAHEKQLEGTQRAGGEASLRRFTHLLGLDDAPEGCRPESLAWVGDHVEVAVGTGEGPAVRFTIARRAADSRGFITTARLVLSYQSKDIPDVLRDRIARRAADRLGPRSLDDLAATLLEDPELGKPGLAMPSADHEHPANQLDTWGGEDAYADFFAGGEIARGQLDSVDLGKFSRNVQHCDVECLFVNPRGDALVANLVEFPWEDRVRDVGVPRGALPERAQREEDDPAGMVSTNLDENDVIMGNPGKLRGVLEQVTALPNPSGKPLFVANTCVPTVTGEDVESVVAEFREKVSYPILYLTVTPQSMNGVLVDLLVTRRKKAEAEAPPPDPRTINLVGFAQSRALRELTELLGRFGLRVGCILLPALETELLERLPGAALNVFCPNSLWSHLYDQLRQDSRVPWIEPAAPYGAGDTWAWVQAVLAALPGGEAPGADPPRALWDAYLAQHAAAWEAARARAEGQRLAVVLRGEEIHYLLSPAETWGVPVARLVQEMGFGLDVLLGARSPRRARRLASQVEPLLEPSCDSRIHVFDSFEAMRALLRDSASGAVLSHHGYDWRAGEAGKSRFSLQHFELGVPGALRSAARLSDLCDTPFFRRYRRYLGRTAEGLRAPAGSERS